MLFRLENILHNIWDHPVDSLKMGKTSNAVLCPVLGTAIQRDMYQLKDDNEKIQKNLATKFETTEVAQLREEDRIVVLKDVKNSQWKGGKIFSYVHNWQKK